MPTERRGRFSVLRDAFDNMTEIVRGDGMKYEQGLAPRSKFAER